MSLRLLIQDELVYEGDPIAVPRVDDVVRHGGQVVPVEAATWDFRQRSVVRSNSCRRQPAVHLLRGGTYQWI